MKITFREIPGGGNFLPALADMGRKRKPLNAALGKRLEIGLRGHFAARDAGGNRNNWPSQHFWDRIRKATAFAGADDKSARVVISDAAINQKIFGGTITPKEGKYLAIPAIAEAYGKSPRIFDFLHFQRGSRGGGALVENEFTQIKIGRKKKDGTRTVSNVGERGGRVWYWLVKSVTQDADANALPSAAVIGAALLDETRAFFDRLPRA
jgi:hypothetical protein